MRRSSSQGPGKALPVAPLEESQGAGASARGKRRPEGPTTRRTADRDERGRGFVRPRRLSVSSLATPPLAVCCHRSRSPRVCTSPTEWCSNTSCRSTPPMFFRSMPPASVVSTRTSRFCCWPPKFGCQSARTRAVLDCARWCSTCLCSTLWQSRAPCKTGYWEHGAILAALAAAGHGGRILLAGGHYPVSTAVGRPCPDHLSEPSARSARRVCRAGRLASHRSHRKCCGHDAAKR